MAIAELVMPKMGESIMEATILRWHKNVGEYIQQEETVLEIATDKVDSEVPSTVSGVIKEILYNVNDVVAVGSVIARIEVADKVNHDAPQHIVPPVSNQNYTIPTAPVTENYQPSATAVADISALQTNYQPEQVPYIPQQIQSKSVTTGNNKFFSPLVLNIANSEGLSLSELERIPGTGADGRVSKKDVLQYITDKRAGKFPAFVPQAAQQPFYNSPAQPAIVPAVQTPVQQVPVTNQHNAPVQQITPVFQQPITAPIPEPVFTAPQPVYIPPQHEQIIYKQAESPIRPIAEQPVPQNVPAPPIEEPIQVQAAPVIKTAEPQVILKNEPVFTEPAKNTVQKPETANVQTAPASQVESIIAPVKEINTSAQPSVSVSEIPNPNVEIIEMDRMRKLIAQHMVNSKSTSAHVTSFAEADVTNMVIWREKIKEDFEKKAGTKITFTPMFIECLTKVMKRYPILNSSVEGDKIIIKHFFNIGMATALPNKNLIVPVIKNAEQLGLIGLAKSVNALANAARNNKLKPDDTQGGTFTFTNVGSFGSLMGTPIINQPQVAILAVGAIKKRPVVIETEKGDFVGIRHMMYLSLSYDHRIIDGSVGASFLTEVAKEFEKWEVNRELKLVVKEQYID